MIFGQGSYGFIVAKFPKQHHALHPAEHQGTASRAGQKLEAALEHFGVDVTAMRVLDAGLSTGGFTDCLLQRGAAHVVGVDVGYGQVLNYCTYESGFADLLESTRNPIGLWGPQSGTPHQNN